MATRRHFIATAATAALTVSVLEPAHAVKGPKAVRVQKSERSAKTEGPNGELKRYNTLASVAQSVPFPEG